MGEPGKRLNGQLLPINRPICVDACVPICVDACVPICVDACVPICVDACVPIYMCRCMCACRYSLL